VDAPHQGLPLTLRSAAALALLVAAPRALTATARADAHDGRVIHAHGAVLATAEGKAYSPYAPDKPVAEPPGETLADDPLECREREVKDPGVPLGDGETVAAIERGAAGPLKEATVVLVRGKREDDLFGYAPMTVRVYEGKEKRAELEVDVTAYPCALVLDDLDGKPDNGNEIAVAWISLGGSGHTAGVSILTLR